MVCMDSGDAKSNAIVRLSFGQACQPNRSHDYANTADNP